MVPPLGQALAMSPREICHSYTTFNTCYNDTGLFGIYAIAPREYWYYNSKGCAGLDVLERRPSESVQGSAQKRWTGRNGVEARALLI